jgi:hypothetical protein
MKPCVVCKKPAPTNRKTCSEECYEVRRQQVKDKYNKKISYPSKQEKSEISKSYEDYNKLDRERERNEIEKLINL